MHGYVMGSCNGLLLMHTDEDLFLWNPLTTFFKKVLAFDRLGDEDYRVRSGLCYDSTSDEYKAVLAFAHQTPSYGGEFVVVGSLKSKSWAVIHFPYRVPTVEPGPIVNENLHWYACKINDSGEDGDIICGLGTLDGCLCMFRSSNSENNVELLVMKDYGVQESWTIMVVVSDCLTSSPWNELLEPLGYTKNGEILTRVWIWMECGWQIWALNPNDNSHRRISIPEDPNCYALIMHKESLIIPTDYDWEEEEQKGEASYVRVDEFKTVPMPKPLKDEDRDILLGLGVLDNCLCMIRHDNQTHIKGNAEVWVMKSYGVQESWNVRFVISSLTFMGYSMLELLYCTKDGEVLMRQLIGYDGGCVNVYNSNGDFCRDVPSPSSCNFSMVAMAYEESLVEPTDYMWENKERRGIAIYVEHFLTASP
ncbi:hypothetical protein C3L33_15338, partial [Rhododendron williamsianum]